MAYSQVGIVNLALGRIGKKRISSMAEGTPQSIAAAAVWEYVRDEVLEAKDWKFAKTRYKLSKSSTTPLYRWSYAYPYPQDFIRLATGRKDDPPVFPDTENFSSFSWLPGTDMFFLSGYQFPYITEALPDGTLCLLTDYDNSAADLYINYIKRVTDAQKYLPSFVNALSYRLAGELAIELTEGLKKFDAMMILYDKALGKATEVNQSLDHHDDTGSNSWETAGRG